MVQVEDFYVAEATELLHDESALEEWQQIADKFCLTGQKKLTEKAPSPIPFQPMTREQSAVYSVLLPKRTDVCEYKSSTIPLRVMRNISLAINAAYFKQLEVWYNERERDPILVGVTDDGGMYLLNRWGEELDAWPQLVKRATKKLATVIRARLERQRGEIDDCLKRVDSLAESFFYNNRVEFTTLPTFYEWDARQ